MVDYYPNKSVEELEATLTDLQTRQTKGALTEFSAAGLKSARLVGATNSRVEVEIRRVLFSLSVRLPQKYANPYAQRNRRTRAWYTFS
jgi:hypothetical protein